MFILFPPLYRRSCQVLDSNIALIRGPPTYLNIIPYNPICRQEKIFTYEQNLPLIIIAIQPVNILPVPLSIIPRAAIDGIILTGNRTNSTIRTIHHSIISLYNLAISPQYSYFLCFSWSFEFLEVTMYGYCLQKQPFLVVIRLFWE